MPKLLTIGYCNTVLGLCPSTTTDRPSKAAPPQANVAVFGNYPEATGLSSNFTDFMGGAVVFETDDYPATVTSDTVPDQWATTAPTSFTAQVSDLGLGIRQVNVSREPRQAWAHTAGQTPSEEKSVTAPCTDETTRGKTGTRKNPCPRDVSIDFQRGDVAEGANNFAISGIDAVGDTATSKLPVKLDTSAPTIEFNGPIVDNANTAEAGVNPLTITASDGSRDAPQNERSGVTRLQVRLDGQVVYDQSQSCPDGSCSMPYDLNFDTMTLDAGNHAVDVTAWDAVGFSTAAPRTILVRKPAQMQFGELTGGSQYTQEIDTVGLGVNVATGNLHVREEDVSALATNAALSLDRHYNSRAPETAALDRQVGRRWLFSVGPQVRLTVDGDRAVFSAPSGFTASLAKQPDGSFEGAMYFDGSLNVLTDGRYNLSVDGNVYTFTAQGELQSFTDEEDKAFNVAFTTVDGVKVLGSLTAASDGSQVAFEYVSNSAGLPLLSRVREPGRMLVYMYTGGLLTSRVASTGEHTTYGYDAFERLNSIAWSSGKSVTINGNDQGRVDSYTVRNPGMPDATTSFAYGSGQTVVTMPDGSSSTYKLNSDGFEPENEPATTSDPIPPRFGDQFDAYGETDTSTNRVRITWEPAEDVVRDQEESSSGLYGYESRISRDGGATYMSDWASSSAPWTYVDSTPVGSTLHVQVRARDQAGNWSRVTERDITTTRWLQSSADPASSFECEPDTDGYAPSCVDDANIDADAENDPETEFAAQARAASSAQPRQITVPGPGVWATARSKQQSYVLGLARAGWTFNTTGFRKVTTKSGTVLKYRVGSIFGNYYHCGWVRGKFTTDPTGPDVQSGCSPSFATYSDQDFAYRVNCQHCDDGSPRTIKSTATRVTFCATVRVNPAKGIPTRCGRVLRRIRRGQIKKGYTVNYRYLTKGRKFVLVRDPHITNNRRGNWSFIRRSALERLCGAAQNCDPNSNNPR